MLIYINRASFTNRLMMQHKIHSKITNFHVMDLMDLGLAHRSRNSQYLINRKSSQAVNGLRHHFVTRHKDTRFTAPPGTENHFPFISDHSLDPSNSTHVRSPRRRLPHVGRHDPGEQIYTVFFFFSFFSSTSRCNFVAKHL